MHTLLNEYGTQHPSLSPLSYSEKDIIKSSLSEITKGRDTVSTPRKHGVWLHQGRQPSELLLALASQPSKKAD